MIACDYSGSLSVKSRWRRFFSLAMFTFGLCRFSKLVSFLRSIVLVNRGFHLVSRSLNQFRFGWANLAFGYLAFWQIVLFGSCQRLSRVQ